MISLLFLLSADILGAIFIIELGNISRAPKRITFLACLIWGILVAMIVHIIEHHGF
jgi:VIT1/CCC1 family predicted Fe2+/Mn2+ transporter